MRKKILKSILSYPRWSYRLIAIGFGMLLLFQNCAKARFDTDTREPAAIAVAGSPDFPVDPKPPTCNPANRPSDNETLFCLPPNSASRLAIQRYTVTCSPNGTWSRALNGSVDYGACPKTCPANTRPADATNVACLAPNQNLMLAVQRYTVTCNANGIWSQAVNGAVNYSACPATCTNPPATTQTIVCPSPNTGIISGTQTRSIICQANGTWMIGAWGNPDYSKCPQSCPAGSKPPTSANVACLSPYQSQMLGVQKYIVTCQANGTWAQVPDGGPDYGSCPKACNANTRPVTTQKMACPAPFQSSVLAVQNYTVTCQANGNWSQVPNGGLDTSACPKSCAGTPPADREARACLTVPSNMSAFQQYAVSCNNNTGQFERTPIGGINYDSCPPPPPAINLNGMPDYLYSKVVPDQSVASITFGKDGRWESRELRAVNSWEIHSGSMISGAPASDFEVRISNCNVILDPYGLGGMWANGCRFSTQGWINLAQGAFGGMAVDVYGAVYDPYTIVCLPEAGYGNYGNNYVEACTTGNTVSFTFEIRLRSNPSIYAAKVIRIRTEIL